MMDVNVRLHRQYPGEPPFVPSAEKTHGGKRTINLLHPEPTWDDKALLQWRATFYHELGHFAPEQVDYYNLLKDKELNDPHSLFSLSLNALEDHRQEKNNLGIYTGRDETLSKGNAMLTGEILAKVGDEFGKLTGDGDISIHTAMLWLVSEARESWQRDMAGMGGAIKHKMSQPMLDKIHEMESRGFVERVENLSTAQEEYELVREILELFERDPDEEEQKAQQPQQGDGEGGGEGSGEAQGREGDGDSGADGGSEESEGRGSDSKSGEGDSKTPRTDAAKINWKDLKPYKHNDEVSPTFTPLDIDFTGFKPKHSDFQVSDDISVRNYVNPSRGNKQPFRDPHSHYASGIDGAMTHTGLANKVRKLLQVKTQTLTVNGQKKGKLATRSMHRVAMKGVGAYRERVFKKKVQQYDLDTAVSVVVDFSGSMGGNKMTHAIASAVMLNESISKIGVPVEVVGFTDRGASCMSIFKEFDKKITNTELKDNMAKGTNMMSGNADGEAILWSYNRLTKQKSKRKLMIVLSDGQPACGRHNCADFTHEVIKNIEKEKRAEIYGIGIQSDSVKHFYSHHTVIRNTSELEDAVIKVIKNHIIS